MSEPTYIWINRWDEFQVYHQKRGKTWTPPWIRVYTRLLDDWNYLSLTARQRGILHDLWLLFAKARLELGLSPARIGRMCGYTDGRDTVRMRDLEALRDAGFIRFCSRTELEQLQEAFWNGSTLARAQSESEIEVEEPSERTESTHGQTLTVFTNGQDNHLLDRLIAWASIHVDDDGAQIRRAARGLPDAVLAQVLEAARGRKVGNRAGYVVACLKAAREAAA